ncbi:helix-turn-helix transcriptional regulator [Curtobacterium flaccumfaciens pv. flaccumfaciens]|uniref:helix-turn-helix transcriptional regulator n=1 Tax=Curtobacterium flaccumfaciens TaxID=2035 RepID=UPI00217CC1FC|nr:AraC family transcriptional regulator [Curtobacterium flaccumfaciens]MCS6586946.1 helix-turn-helix transcriptional regulator [Curtobacterium flaccumfaciens pv. flaccumfaciens]
MNDPTAATAPVTPLVAVAGHDTDLAIASLAGMYAGKAWYARPLDEDYWFKYVGVGDEQLSIRRSQMHGYLRGDVAVEGEIVVQWLEHGQARVDVGRDEIRMQPGIPTMFPLERRFHVEYENWDQRLVHLSRDLVLDVATEQHLIDGTLDFQTPQTPNDAALHQWRASVAVAVRALRTAGTESLAWHEAQRDVARALLTLFPLRAERLSHDVRGLSNKRLRLAVEFIHAHAHEPLTVGDIAAAAGMSIRGLQEAFTVGLHTTPLTYVRDIRLSHIHDELRASDRGSVQVQEVARRWGFGHMGRFSSTYAARYNEYPRQTLRR